MGWLILWSKILRAKIEHEGEWERTDKKSLKPRGSCKQEKL